jgi:uncharacterized Zn finger protein (UPF0148 family)
MGGRFKRYMIDVHCNTCRTMLFRYEKEGEGHLVKCYADNIIKNFTEDQTHCPVCTTEFARPATIHCRPAYKIIQGKVFVK